MSEDRQPEPAPMLASDAERDASVLQLREAVGEGRLTLEEFSDRVAQVQEARTDQDLAKLTRDLPAGREQLAVPAATERHRAVCSHLTRGGPWSLPARSSWRSVFGTIDLDLREARLASPEIALDVHNVFGTVTVIVPEGVEVVVRGGGCSRARRFSRPSTHRAPERRA